MLVELMLAILILMVIRFSLSFFLAARCGKKSEDFTFRSSKRIHLWNVHLCCSIDTPIRVHPKFTVTNLFYPRLSSDLKVFFGILRTNIDKQNKQKFYRFVELKSSSNASSMLLSSSSSTFASEGIVRLRESELIVVIFATGLEYIEIFLETADGALLNVTGRTCDVACGDFRIARLSARCGPKND